MSAFVVADKTINSIVSFLGVPKSPNNGQIWGIAGPVTRLGYDVNIGSWCPEDDAIRTKHQERLAKDLHSLNCSAVAQRYPNQPAPNPDGFAFQQVGMAWETMKVWLTIHKMLACLIYQCSEGNIPETDLFQALKETRRLLAEHIVCSLPEWDAIAWG